MAGNSVNKSLFLILALVISVLTGFSSVPSRAYDVKSDIRAFVEVQNDLSGKTIILHSNDVHGAIEGYAYVAALKKKLQKDGAEVILVDSGDYSQGTYKGLDAINAMNAAGYDIATIGNHEFDYGFDNLQAYLSSADFRIICADIYDSNNDSITDPNTIYVTESGVKLGFFGLATPETPHGVKPVYVEGLKFLSGKEMYDCAQNQINELKAQGSDLIICLSHLGVKEESAIDGNRSLDVYANTKGMDIMLDAHSHTVMTQGVNGEPVSSTGAQFQNIGVVIIDDAKKTIEDHYLLDFENVKNALEPDPAAKATINSIIKRVQDENGIVVVESEVDLVGDRSPGNRTQETNMGNLVTDALVWSITGEDGIVTVQKDHVVSVINGGSVKKSIGKGNVTKNDFIDALPYANTITVVCLTGEQLLEALEASTFCIPQECGSYPQTAGIKFTIDTTVPFAEGEVYPTSDYHRPVIIRRVTIHEINGQPFSLDDTYAIVTNDYCASGGGGYGVFKNASDHYDTGIYVTDAIIDYLKEEFGGVIPESIYGSAENEQTIIIQENK
ncbi:bifunctional metallophosphatase/5'-nucleotidase [Butyrivibrio sp. JL13D10]|uniref:bifunctional metallophosphatase/5'-nucleotidase n=1 Tax=Butyrivibrio sp. JL13D10 TaxID=3236815 RepID=UPI0038B4742E